MKKLFYSLLALTLVSCGSKKQTPIDREALVNRNSQMLLLPVLQMHQSAGL